VCDAKFHRGRGGSFVSGAGKSQVGKCSWGVRT